MKVKEITPEYRMVLVPTVGEQSTAIIFLLGYLSIAIVVYWHYSDPIASIPLLLAVFILLYVLGELISHKVIIGRSTHSIVLRTRYFLLVPKQHVIPFSTVVNVKVVVRMRFRLPRLWEDYELHIHCHSRQGLEAVIIDRAEDADKMLELAADIRRIIGEEELKRRAEQE